MRITIDTDDCNAPERAMATFHNAKEAVSYMRYRMQFDERACCILTREAAADFLGAHYEDLDELPFQLMREIHPMDDEQGGPTGDLGPSTRRKTPRSGCGPHSGPDNSRRGDFAPRDHHGDGSLNFTNVQPDDIDTIHDSLPCGAEIREFVRQYECWQLWMR